MIFKSRKRSLTPTPDILIEGNEIDRVEFSKFLGIIINPSLTWSYHINLIKQQVSKTIGILKYVSNKLSCDVLKLLYFALVNPYYNYGNMGKKWFNCTTKFTITRKKPIE